VEFYADTRTFVEQVADDAPKPASATVDEPLDDGAFLFFLRSVPLVVGETYEFNRYFRPDRNPVSIRVLRRERISVPAGEVDAIVVQPVLNTKGIFSKNGRAEVWLTDDDRRLLVQVKAELSFGTVNLALKEYRGGAQPMTLAQAR
jgi:hypothetical protein